MPKDAGERSATRCGAPAAADEHLLALDIGTTTVRAILFDLAGTPLVEAYREPPVHHPRPNRAEVDAEDWWQCAVEAIGEVRQFPGAPAGKILGIGLSGLLHALVPVDGAGSPLARVMLWMDQRCQPQVEWLAHEHGELIEALMGGVPMSTTWSAPKLRWIAEHDPEVLRRTSKLLPAKDFIRLRLTGTVATDPSDAHGTALFDHRSGDWSHRLLEAVGVAPEKMPPIRESTAVGGRVTREAAALTGLPAGTPVVVGGGDTKCTRIGAGTLDTGRACLYLGTAAWISVPQGQATFFGATATTGATLKWLLGLFGPGSRGAPGEAYASLLREAERAPAGARGLVLLPHLMGERGPQDNPKARGVLFGLTLAHGRPELARAALEGCAFQVRAILDSLGARCMREMVVAGGGAKSALWRGIIADVTGATLLVPQVLEAGALGAAILAGVGVGAYPSVQAAAGRLVRMVERREPDAAAHELYEPIYRLFLELEERVAPLYGRAPLECAEEGFPCA